MKLLLLNIFLLTLLPVNIYSLSIYNVTENSPYSKYDEFISSNETEECVKQLVSTDNCIAKMLFLNDDKYPVPKSMDDINSYCK